MRLLLRLTSCKAVNRSSALRTSQRRIMSPAIAWSPKETPYPAAKRGDTKQEHASKEKGTVIVQDPYRGLEEDSPDTQQFVEDQAAFTEAYLRKADDLRKGIQAEITQNFNYPRVSPPSLRGDHYYFSYNTGLQSQTPIFRQHKSRIHDSNIANASLFFDPNLLSTDGTVSVGAAAFSHTGKYYAYGLSRSGSDWQMISVRSTDSPHDPKAAPGSDHGNLKDKVEFVKFSGIAWTHDDKESGQGFFYSRFPKPAPPQHNKSDDKQGTEVDANVNHKVFYHKLGTSQDQDILIMEDKDSEKSHLMYGTEVTEDGKYVIIYTRRDTSRSKLVHIAELSSIEGLRFKPIISDWGNDWEYLTNDGNQFYFTTNKDAPRDKVVTYDLEKPDAVKFPGFTDLVSEDEKGVLTSASVHANDKLLLVYKIDVVDRIFLHDLRTGKRLKSIGDTSLIGTVESLRGKREQNEFWLSLASFVSPGQIFRYQFDGDNANELCLYRAAQVDGIKAEDYATEQIFFESKDGTKIPMFIITPKWVKRDGSAPALLYGYGGFSVSIDPAFSVSWMSFIKGYSGVLAVANLRGGSEYGEAWHLAGTLGNKQNVFDDFQAAAKYLKDNQRAGKVICSGGSNGGLLVAACVNQAPTLFDAGIADVGVHDMLRFHLFTIGRAWRGDYGDPDEGKDFDFIYKYSPLHNVDGSKAYPPLMLTTGDHDDRVSPLHSFKLAATLQHKLKDNKHPLLLRIELKAGHGAGKSTAKRIAEAADKWTFVGASLGLEWQKR